VLGILPAVLALNQAAVAQDHEAQIALGQKRFEYWCAACHGPGIGSYGMPYLPGEMALRAKYKGTEPPLLPDRTDLSAELIRTVVRHGITIMPFFRKTEISDEDLDAMVAFLTRNNPKQ
jgi:mono/diheme cytochrome c family protein